MIENEYNKKSILPPFNKKLPSFLAKNVVKVECEIFATDGGRAAHVVCSLPSLITTLSHFVARWPLSTKCIMLHPDVVAVYGADGPRCGNTYVRINTYHGEFYRDTPLYKGHSSPNQNMNIFPMHRGMSKEKTNKIPKILTNITKRISSYMHRLNLTLK